MVLRDGAGRRARPDGRRVRAARRTSTPRRCCAGRAAAADVVMRTLDVLIDIDGVLYPFPEMFTPYAAGAARSRARARHDALGVLRGVGRRLRRLRRPRHPGRRRAPAVVGGRAVRRRARRRSPGCAPPATACTSSRPVTSPAPRRRWRRPTTGSPLHDLRGRVGQPGPGQADGARRRSASTRRRASPSTTARSTSLAWEERRRVRRRPRPLGHLPRRPPPRARDLGAFADIVDRLPPAAPETALGVRSGVGVAGATDPR